MRRRALPVAVALAVLLLVVQLLASVVVSDTFTDSAGDALAANHTGETGATWTVCSGCGSSDAFRITNANRLRLGVADVDATVCASGSPSSANYDVEADFVVQSTFNGEAIYLMGGRGTTASFEGYYFFFIDNGSPNATLWRFSPGNDLQLDDEPITVNTSTTYHFKLEMRGTAIKVYRDGVQILSATDSFLASAGKACLGGFVATTADSNADGIHLDNFLVTDVDSVGSPGLLVFGVGR